MKTSPELLTEILGVLGSINQKMDTVTGKKDRSSAFGTGVTLSSILKGKKSDDGISTMADSIKKLNKELDKVNITKLNRLISSIERYEKMPRKSRMEKIGGMASSAKDMGLALLYTAGGVTAFVGAFKLAAADIGGSGKTSPWAVLGFIAATFLVLSISMLMLSGADAAGEKLSMGILSQNTSLKGFRGIRGDKGRNRGAIQSAKDMGIAMMFIAGGVLSFATTLLLVPLMLGLKNKEGEPAILAGVGVIAAIIIGLAGTIALLGLAGMLVAPGIMAAKGIGVALGIITLGILAVAFGSKLFMSLGDKDAKTKEGKSKGKFGQLIAGVGTGLGLFGLFLISAVGLFWTMGLPIVSGPVLLGATALIGVSLSLLTMVKATKKITEAVKDIGGKEGIQTLTQNIQLLIGGVMDGVVRGILGDPTAGRKGLDTSGDGILSIKELREFRRVTRAIKMFGKISTSLSRFASGLKAFAKVGQISSLEYKEDADGNLKPVLGGDTIHVVEIAQSIGDTFGLFIKTMIDNTENLSRDQAGALRRFSKALSGRKGLISGVIQFAEALKTYAEFGKARKIYVATYDKDGNIDETKKEGVPISFVVESITSTFGSFIDFMAAKAPLLESMNIHKMRKFNEALMGKKGIFGREKPGLLDAVTEFSDMLAIYATYGKDNMIPIKNDKGEIIGKMPVYTVAANMVKGISEFISKFEVAAGSGGLEKKAKDIKNKIKNFTDIIGQFDKLAKSQEGMEKLANSMGLLASNVGLLVNNMSGLNTENLSKLATITAQHAVITKGVPISHTTQTSPTSTTAVVSQPDWDKIADKMGQRIAEKLNGTKNGEFNFTFYDGASGGKLEIKEK